MQGRLRKLRRGAGGGGGGGEEQEEEEEEEEAVCVECGDTPCEWKEFGDQVLESARQLYDHEEDEGGGAGVI